MDAFQEFWQGLKYVLVDGNHQKGFTAPRLPEVDFVEGNVFLCSKNFRKLCPCEHILRKAELCLVLHDRHSDFRSIRKRNIRYFQHR